MTEPDDQEGDWPNCLTKGTMVAGHPLRQFECLKRLSAYRVAANAAVPSLPKFRKATPIIVAARKTKPAGAFRQSAFKRVKQQLPAFGGAGADNTLFQGFPFRVLANDLESALANDSAATCANV